jgi:hypothetical protein
MMVLLMRSVVGCTAKPDAVAPPRDDATPLEENADAFNPAGRWIGTTSLTEYLLFSKGVFLTATAEGAVPAVMGTQVMGCAPRTVYGDGLWTYRGDSIELRTLRQDMIGHDMPLEYHRGLRSCGADIQTNVLPSQSVVELEVIECATGTCLQFAYDETLTRVSEEDAFPAAWELWSTKVHHATLEMYRAEGRTVPTVLDGVGPRVDAGVTNPPPGGGGEAGEAGREPTEEP